MKRYQPIIGIAIVLVLGIAIGVILVGQNPDSPLSLASSAHAQPAARAGGPVPGST